MAGSWTGVRYGIRGSNSLAWLSRIYAIGAEVQIRSPARGDGLRSVRMSTAFVRPIATLTPAGRISQPRDQIKQEPCSQCGREAQEGTMLSPFLSSQPRKIPPRGPRHEKITYLRLYPVIPHDKPSRVSQAAVARLEGRNRALLKSGIRRIRIRPTPHRSGCPRRRTGFGHRYVETQTSESDMGRLKGSTGESRATPSAI